ncbi:MAG: hypothetical protein LBQ08_05005 [Holosporaceae bacterium]|nr:hypothetical protein [Holosporaceae bacterium]
MNIYLSIIFAGLACYNIVAAPLSRISSEFQFSTLDQAEDTVLSLENYDTVVQNLKNNIWKNRTGPCFNSYLCTILKYACPLFKKLGWQVHKIKTSEGAEKEAIILDTSWPTIRNYAYRLIDSTSSSREAVSNNIAQLKAVLDEFGQIGPNKNGKTTKFDDVFKQTSNLYDTCIGRHIEGVKLFDLSELPDTGTASKDSFKKLLMDTLKNYSAFQEIMSMLVVSILNSEEQTAFVPHFTLVKIRILTKEEKAERESDAFFYQSAKSIVMSTQYFETQNSDVLIHEAAHAFHYMIANSDKFYGNMDRLFVYNVLNSKEIDFRDKFFPMLRKENMDPVIKKLEPYAKKAIDIAKNDSAVKNKILKLFQILIDFGFANVIFDKVVTLVDPNQCVPNKIMTGKNLARALYIRAFALQKFDERNFRIHDGKKALEELSKGETIGLMWKDPEEILTIYGAFPLVAIGDFYLIMQDKQNQNIYDFRGGKEDFYGFHAYNYDEKRMRDFMRDMLSSLGVRSFFGGFRFPFFFNYGAVNKPKGAIFQSGDNQNMSIIQCFDDDQSLKDLIIRMPLELQCEMLLFLIREGVNFNIIQEILILNDGNGSLISRITKNLNIVKDQEIIKFIENMNHIKKITSLKQAVNEKNYYMFKFEFNKPDLNKIDEEYRYKIICMAAEHNDKDFIEHLIKNEGFKINLPKLGGILQPSPLDYAVNNNNRELLEFLLDNLDNSNSNYIDTLSFVAQLVIPNTADNNRLDLFKVLIDRGADPLLRKHRYTILLSAFTNCNIDVAKFLVEEKEILKKFDPPNPDKLKSFLVGAISNCNNDEAIKFIKDNFGNIQSEIITDVLYYALLSLEKVKAVDLLLKNFSDVININAINKQGETPLTALISSGNFFTYEKILCLLAHGADASEVDSKQIKNRSLLEKLTNTDDEYLRKENYSDDDITKINRGLEILRKL